MQVTSDACSFVGLDVLFAQHHHGEMLLQAPEEAGLTDRLSWLSGENFVQDVNRVEKYI